MLNSEHKTVGSTGGHVLASTSDLHLLRQERVDERIGICRRAILDRDFERFASVVEEDSNLMHAVMRTSKPSLNYWLPETEVILWKVIHWRKKGIPVCSTVDAGPNVHVLTLSSEAEKVEALLKECPGVKRIYKARAGQGARLI